MCTVDDTEQELTLKLFLGAVLGWVGRLINNQLTVDFEQAGYSIMVEQFAYWFISGGRTG